MTFTNSKSRAIKSKMSSLEQGSRKLEKFFSKPRVTRKPELSTELKEKLATAKPIEGGWKLDNSEYKKRMAEHNAKILKNR